MNNCTLIGRLTKDPELRYTADNFAICKFSIAIDRIGKEKKTNYIPIKALGKTAENCAKFLAKGRLVGVWGSIETDSYKKDGITHYTWEVLAGSVEFLESKPKIEEAPQQAPNLPTSATTSTSWDAINDDIPF